MKTNVCKFSDSGAGDDDIFAFQFVYETMPQRLEPRRTPTAFICHLVTEGSAVLVTEEGRFHLKMGDIFFLFPSSPYALEDCKELKYMYISFVGNRPSDLLESVGATRRQPVLNGFNGLIDVWLQGLSRATSLNLSCLAKGLLYYTFAMFPWGNVNAARDRGENDMVLGLRNMIDCCYADPDLSLETLCVSYRYSSKYLSRRFQETVGVGFKEYLENCRIRHACVLLRETAYPIGEIACSVGYRDPLYFSKVFKKVVGQSPKEYRLSDVSIIP